jgi:hypothetical protein
MGCALRCAHERMAVNYKATLIYMDLAKIILNALVLCMMSTSEIEKGKECRKRKY